MKKLLSIGAIIVSVMFLSSCGHKNSQNNQKQNQNTSPQQDTSQQNDQSQKQTQKSKQLKTSFEDLSKMAQDMKCIYSTKNSNGILVKGTVYSSKDGRLRVEQRMKDQYKTDLIIKDGWIYSWSDLGSRGSTSGDTPPLGVGTKFKIETIKAVSENMPNQSKQSQQIKDIIKDMEMDCSPWSVNESKLELPETVNFKDMDSALKNFATSQ